MEGGYSRDWGEDSNFGAGDKMGNMAGEVAGIQSQSDWLHVDRGQGWVRRDSEAVEAETVVVDEMLFAVTDLSLG